MMVIGREGGSERQREGESRREKREISTLSQSYTRPQEIVKESQQYPQWNKYILD